MAKSKTEQRKENRERQRKYRERQKANGLKQVNIFINPDEIKTYEKIVRTLSKTLFTNNEPSPNRQDLYNLAEFLKKISNKNN